MCNKLCTQLFFQLNCGLMVILPSEYFPHRKVKWYNHIVVKMKVSEFCLLLNSFLYLKLYNLEKPHSTWFSSLICKLRIIVVFSPFRVWLRLDQTAQVKQLTQCPAEGWCSVYNSQSSRMVQ